MSYLGLLVHDVMIFNPSVDSDGNEDYERYGDEELVYDAGTPSKARVEQQESTENEVDRDTRVQSFLVFLPPEATLSALSYMEWEGRTLRLNGEPKHLNGRTAAVHHIEATCQEVLG